MRMRRATTPIVVLFLMGGIAVAATRLLLHREPFQNAPIKPAAGLNAEKTKTVSYKGISFSYDPSLAPEIKSETISAMVDGKPSDIVPEHPGFTLIGYRQPRATPKNNSHIRVFSIAKFRDAVSMASKEYAKTVVFPSNLPDWTVYFDEEVRVLRALLAKHPKPENLKTFIKIERDKTPALRMGNGYPQMPFLPMWEATQAFIGHVRYVNFKDGKGVFFLTQWDTDTHQITNGGLEYAFQGMTSDGKYWVYAEFSVAAPFLPSDDDPAVIAWVEKNYLLEHKSKKYQSYLRPVLAKLEPLSADKFQPNLELFEQLIQSLEVKEN
jgi:hypothetical protein